MELLWAMTLPGLACLLVLLVALERFAPRYDVRALTFLQMATSFAGFLVIAIALGELEVPRGGTVWAALLVTGLFAGALGMIVTCIFVGLTRASRPDSGGHGGGLAAGADCLRGGVGRTLLSALTQSLWTTT